MVTSGIGGCKWRELDVAMLHPLECQECSQRRNGTETNQNTTKRELINTMFELTPLYTYADKQDQ